MAIVQHVVGWHDEHKQYQQQIDSDALVLLRLLHSATVVGQRSVGTHLLEELCIDLIIIGIQRPLMQGQRCHRTLVANVENNLIVGIDAIVQPLYLWRRPLVAKQLQQQLSFWMLRTVVRVECRNARVGKL